MLGAVLSAIVLGLFIGGLARFAVPGPDPMPVWLTISIGLVGSLIGGGVAAAIAGTSDRNDVFAVLLSSVAAATLLVIAYRRFYQGRPVAGPEAQRMPSRGFGIARLRAGIERMGIDPDSVGHPGGPQPLRRGDETSELLQKLEDLRRAGLLTPEEFEQKRAALLTRPE
jgi:uncharacterized membrane protein YeaQ/YmgE (transglycosylase-associated protein family)